MSPEKTPSAQEQIARNGLITEVPGVDSKVESLSPVDDSAEKQGVGRVLSVGDRVSVLRSPKPGSTEKWLDRSGWKVVETNPSVTIVENGDGNGTKSVSTVELVDLQERLDEKLRRDLGEGAVEISGIRQPVAPESAQTATPEKDPIDDLSEKAKAEVLEYRRAVRNKTESERSNNFAQAAEDGRAVHRVRQDLSREALDFLKISR